MAGFGGGMGHGPAGHGAMGHGAMAGASKAPPFSFWSSMGDLVSLVLRSRAAGLRSRLLAALGLVLVGKLAGIVSPIFLGEAVNILEDSLRHASATHLVEGLSAAFIGVMLAAVALRLVSAAAPLLRDMIFQPVSQAAMARSAVESFSHTLALSLDFHAGKQSGGLARIIDRGARSTDFLLRSVVLNLGPTAIELVLAAAVLSGRYSWLFALVTVVTVIFYVIFTFTITNWRIGHRRALNDADSAAAGLAVDALMNYETVKTFGSETRVTARYEGAMGDYARAAVLANNSLQMLNVAQAVVLNAGWVTMAVVAGVEVMNGHMRLGAFTAALGILTQVFQPLNQLGSNYREIRQAFIDMEQMIDLRDLKPEITDASDAADLPPARGAGAELAFEHVAFQHNARSVGLKDISFVAPPGTTTALVGPSGAGKTTMSRLALRLLDPQSGRVTLDGMDLKKVRLSSLRAAVTLVPQDVALFNDTLRANIAFGRPEAGEDDIREAAEAAELTAFIESLPDGLNTRVGERGLKLSGGERQRVGIARALLADPRLLVLDEATSALDGRTEAAIQETLRKVRRGRTTLVIAHRLSTIADADQIIVLRRGRVVERGDHATLLSQAGEYAALWRRQTRAEAAGIAAE